MQVRTAVRFLWPLWLTLMYTAAGAASGSSDSEEQLRQLLTTESTLINALKTYINALDQQMEVIKSEIANIAAIHEQVGDQVLEHIGNPLNVLTILKRFHSVWPMLEQQANATLSLAEHHPQLNWELKLPSEQDYEQALLNLLRLQSVYDLRPDTLALGMANGLKLGSSMSWSDCLEMARSSNQNGDYAIAKYWLETALEQLPEAQNSTSSVSEQQRGKIQILEASLSMDYRTGEYASALATVKELLLLRPARQSMQKAKTKIEQAIQRSKGKLFTRRKPKAKLMKSVEQQLMHELCRLATQQSTTGSRISDCRLDLANLRLLRLEQLSRDPHIMLYHDILNTRQAKELITLLDSEQKQQEQLLKEVSFTPLKVSKLAQKRLQSIFNQLPMGSGVPDLWQARLQSHEHVTMSEDTAQDSQGYVARALLNLQEAKLGGATVFPQLELGVNMPQGSMLYWRCHSNEDFPAVLRPDYRSRQLVCPVLLGTQLTAWTTLR